MDFGMPYVLGLTHGSRIQNPLVASGLCCSRSSLEMADLEALPNGCCYELEHQGRASLEGGITTLLFPFLALSLIQ